MGRIRGGYVDGKNKRGSMDREKEEGIRFMDVEKKGGGYMHGE